MTVDARATIITASIHFVFVSLRTCDTSLEGRRPPSDSLRLLPPRRRDLSGALAEYRQAYALDASNGEAGVKVANLQQALRERIEAARAPAPIEALRARARRDAEPPLLNPASDELLVLEFTDTNLRDILAFLGDAGGINVTDEEFEDRPAAASGYFNLNTITRGVSIADFYTAVPTAVVNFLQQDTDTRLVAQPQLAARKGRPIGVILNMTPRVTYENEIILDLEVENSTLGPSILVAGQSLPTFCTRHVETRLRLRDGESNLLAGLLREQDRQTLKGIPGLMRLPVLRQLFSASDRSVQNTDIVMLLTPRIVRGHELTQQHVSPIHIGTQGDIGITGPPPSIAAAPDAAPEPAGEPPDR